MSPKEAAELIGCSTNQVYVLIRSEKLKARKVTVAGRTYYDVAPASARAYAARPQTQGFPRGESRNK